MKRLVCSLLLLSLILASLQPVLADAPTMRTFTDSVGRTVELPVQIDRIAPSGKLAHIVLYALAPEKFCCMSNPWTKDAAAFFPESSLNLPVVGQFYGDGTLNMEALAAADPQVIIDIGEVKKSVKEDMDAVQAQLGIPTVFIEATTKDMGDCYRKLGELLGMPERAGQVAQYCDDTYNRTASRMDKMGDAGKAKILYCLGENGLNVIAKGSYHAEIIDMMADNVGIIENPSSKAFGDPVSLEQVLLWDPEFVFFAPDVDVDAVLKDAGWQTLKAIKGGQYAKVPAGPFNWMGFPPSVNRYMGLVWMGSVLYPDVFTEDLFQEAKAYYGMFYGYELTAEKLQEIVKG